MPIIQEDPFRKFKPEKFKFDQVKEDVTDAMQFDWKRDKVDDAKKKAIYDSRSYDEFKSRVAGCTLKPIHRNEFNEAPKFAFNRQVGREATAGLFRELQGGAEAAEAAGVKGTTLKAASHRDGGVASLKNGREFEREIRRCPTADGIVELLAQFDDSTYKRLFGRECDAEVLRRVLVALDEGSTGERKGTARGFLSTLTAHCPESVAMSATFLTAVERGIIARLLAREPANDPSDDVRICAAFGVTPSSVAAAASELHLEQVEQEEQAENSTPDGVSIEAPVDTTEEEQAETSTPVAPLVATEGTIDDMD
jgi:hypothetical protein